ncbi:putative dehydration-responsive element-binding protein 2H [Trifolium repens]|nr:putative dehydration-responsive element-binding protein 2H [Trifolium repens]
MKKTTIWYVKTFSVRLGTFPNVVAAALAYDEAARAMYGACARLNFPNVEVSNFSQLESLKDSPNADQSGFVKTALENNLNNFHGGTNLLWQEHAFTRALFGKANKLVYSL